METSLLQISEQSLADLTAHLLPKRPRYEEAAFGFAKAASEDSVIRFNLVDWMPVPDSGFELRSRYFLELSDATRAQVIKKAHDLDASLIEFHSHPFSRIAEFSVSDHRGFEDCVPHILWRLRARPYAAFVFARSSFDAIAWNTNVFAPAPLARIKTDRREIAAIGTAFKNWSHYHGK